MGKVLTGTSQPLRTSPVHRGKWMLDTVLGSPAPTPPPNVPPLKEEPFTGGKILSVRERLEKHRANPICASCHRAIDPLGFALENYDSLGQYRVKDEGGNVIDSAGTMPDGTSVNAGGSVRISTSTRQSRTMWSSSFFATLRMERTLDAGLIGSRAAPRNPANTL